MTRIFSSIATCASLFLATGLLAPELFAATPAGGTISPSSTTATWTGGVPVSSPVTGCFPLGTPSPLCDFFKLTITPPSRSSYLVRISIVAASGGDDIDLSVRDPSGDPIASSTTGSGTEDVVL